MAAKRPLVSIVCPAYNEELVLPPFHRVLLDVLADLSAEFQFEIIYVNDGSRDGTLELLKSMSARDSRVRWLSFSRNFGHQAALTAGMEHAHGDAIITMDSDLQHPPELIGSLLKKWREGFDVVLTVREEDPTLSIFKRWTSNGFYYVLRWLSDAQIPIAAADYRLLSRKALTNLVQMREVHRFLRGMVYWLGFSTAQVHYVPGQRAAGKSHYSLRKMLRLAGDGIFAFSLTPLRWLAGVGMGVLGLGIVTALGLIIAAMAGANLGSPLLSVLLVAVLMLGGSVLAGLGLVGEYVGRTFEQVKGRPVFVLESSSDETLTISKLQDAA
ncbi:MAG: glycosyltransferase family 2 protein [Planctomycetes bacterium]|nr:glycosyltransferase family 2 protein [Planctomycetota bacterium]